MSNIIDYLKWRGDLSFKESSFNEIDALILSFIAYVEFDFFLTDINNKTLEELNNNINNITEKEIFLDKISMVRMSLEILNEASKTNRFKNIRLINYRNEIDLDNESQFSVMTFILDEKDIFISYRGTDESIVGWKEDFNMLFLSEVPGQVKAFRYLNSLDLNNVNNLYIGGHSKGGNLAIFASVMTDSSIRNKITSIFNFDGPGFKKEFLENKNYKEICPKIKTFIPEESIIGLIFYRLEEPIVIKSLKSGFLQHNAYFWEILGRKFVYSEISNKSTDLDRILKDLVNNLSSQQIKDIVNITFEFLDKINIKNVEDFYNLNFNSLQEFFKFSNDIPEDCKKSFLFVIKFFITEIKNKNLNK